MVTKDNYYQEYEGFAKLLNLISSHFVKREMYGMTRLLPHAQYIYIICAKYPKAAVKALVQVDFPVYALSKYKTNKQTGKKAKFTWL